MCLSIATTQLIKGAMTIPLSISLSCARGRAVAAPSCPPGHRPRPRWPISICHCCCCCYCCACALKSFGHHGQRAKPRRHTAHKAERWMLRLTSSQLLTHARDFMPSPRPFGIPLGCSREELHALPASGSWGGGGSALFRFCAFPVS